MIEGMYSDALGQAIQDRANRPVLGPTPSPVYSWGDLAKAPFEGAASGLLETAATWDPLYRPPGMPMRGGGAAPLSAEQIKGALAVNTDRQQSDLRSLAKDVMPDAATSSTAANAVAGFANYGAKAAGYIGSMGPAGAAPFAADLFSTEKARLVAQGVDEATASQAAWQSAAFGAGSMLVPGAAATRVGRAALGLAVGEGANVGQQASEQFILQHAGYPDQAAQFDPFDPVSLAVGAVPGVLGAVLPGHARPTARDIVQHLETGGLANPDAAVSRTGAEGKMQVEPATQLDPGFGVRPADLSGTPEQQAAEKTRVGNDYFAAMQARYGGDDMKAMAAYNAGPGRLDAILEAHPNDWQEHLPQETKDYLRKAQALMGPVDPATAAAARVTQMTAAMDDTRLTPADDLAGRDDHQQALETAFDQVGRGDPVEVSDIVRTPEQPLEQPPELGAQADLDAPFAEAPHVDPAAAQRVTSFADAVRQLGDQRRPPEPAAVRVPETQRAEGETPRAADETNAAPRGTAEPDPGTAHLDSTIADIAREHPELMVHLDGMDHPMLATDLLAHMQEEAQRTGRDSQLLKIAAQCAIRS